MARQKTLTDAKIRDLQPQDKAYKVPVEGLPMHLRVNPNGKKVYVVKYRLYLRNETKQIVHTLDDTSHLNLEDAKEKATILIKQAKRGIDQRELWRQADEQFQAEIQTASIEAMGFADLENPAFLKTAWFTVVGLKVGVSKRHEQKMRQLWRHAVEHWNDTIRTKDVTVEKLLRVKKALEDRPQEFNKFRMVLNTVLRHETYEGRIDRNVVSRVQPFPLKYRQTILSERGVTQFKEFFANTEQFLPKERNHARFLLALLYTGVRPNMLRSLCREDDGENNFMDWGTETGKPMMVFRKDKTSKKRREQAAFIPITKPALEVFKAAASATPWSPFVFGSHDNRRRFRDLPLSEKRNQEFFRKHAYRFDVEGAGKFDIYCLRHSFGSVLAAAGIPINQVAEMMLHANITTTQRYIKSTEKTRQSVVERIEEII
ncbi:tyrosine-type recombinase/integrase [Tabrizicola sp.]|uniref:tyrosine-type recombinase/integrase n=1 Tax=Tabrizicola sp. TaxID=2005166 RepID=UPI003D2E9C35